MPGSPGDPPFDPYDVLGVSPLADGDEIKRAYRAMARRLHPDTNGHDAAASARFLEATAAYELLRDDARRRAYDLRRAVHHGPRPMRTAPAPTGNTQVRGPGARPSHRPRTSPPLAPARPEADPLAFARLFVKVLVVAIVLLVIGVAVLVAIQPPECAPGQWRACRQPSPTIVPGG